MDKAESIKKESILQNEKAKVIIGTILLSAVGVAMPRIFHIVAGTTAGAIFLPMHIAVLLASLIFGTISGTVVAGSSVIFSYILTGMPTAARLPYMAIELVIYAVLLGVINKKQNAYISLMLTMIVGRIIYAGVMFVSTNVLMLNSYGISVFESIKSGMPGIILQLLFVPLIAKFIKERIK